MGDIADCAGFLAGQVAGPGGVELLVDPLLLRCLTQLLIVSDS